MLFSRREEEQTLWVLGVIDKRRGQRERGCHSGGQRADMAVLRGSAQPKKSESLDQVFSQSLTENSKQQQKKRFNVCWLSA